MKMKKIILAAVLLLPFLSCEEVIEVNPKSEAPRLIIDALIRIDTAEQLTEANIKVSLTSSFFGEIEPTAIESMSIQDEASGLFVPYEPIPGEPGMYRPFPTTVSPVSDNKILTTFLTNAEELLLFVRHEDQLYIAKTNFVPSVPIDSVVQGDGTLFGEEETEVIVNFTDAPDREDFYVFDLDFDEFITSEDTFIEGQQFQFSYFYDQDLKVGDEVEISILGATESFFNYMNGLIEQSEQGDNGPFQTPTATVRGNFLNTGIDNIDQFDNVNRPNAFILGYFALAEEYKDSVIIE